MCDTLMLCFWTWAIALWIKGLDTADGRWLGAAALLIAMASLTKYFGVGLIPPPGSLHGAPRAEADLEFGLAARSGALSFRISSVDGAALTVAGLLLDAAEYSISSNAVLPNSVWAKMVIALSFTGGAAYFPSCSAAPWLWSKRWLIATLAVVAAIGLFYMVDHVAGTLTGASK